MFKHLGATGWIIAIAVIVFVAMSALFIVDETEQGIVLQFGEPKRVESEPGLKAKIPFVQSVIYYDKRLLDLDPPAEEMILSDQKRVVVDTFSRYLIQDPLKFYQAVRAESQARAQLANIVINKTREVLGNVTLPTILSEKREDVMINIRELVNAEAETLGIEMVDVRIRRADLPVDTTEAILRRMISEREREAREFRAQGEEQAQRIRSRADRERTVLLAEAEKEAQILRGQGDAEAYRIYNEAFGKDQEFFAFYRSLEAYRKSLTDPDSMFVLSPDNEFFRYFGETNRR